MRTRKIAMSKVTLFALALSLFMGAFVLKSQAQESKNYFVVVDFMKVKQGDEAKYVELEKEVWRPIHEERIKQGEIVGWVLYAIHYAGSDDEYNFVTAALFDDPAKLEHTFQVDMEKVHPGKDLDKAFAETLSSRELVRKQLLYRDDFVYPEGGPGDFKYIQVNFMKVKPGNGGAYVEHERKVWKPVHQALVDAGTRWGWSLWECVYPMGAGMPYDYVTVDYYADFSKLGAADIMEAFEKAHPGKMMNELTTETNQVRKQVKAELWEVIDSAWKQE